MLYLTSPVSRHLGSLEDLRTLTGFSRETEGVYVYDPATGAGQDRGGNFSRQYAGKSEIFGQPQVATPEIWRATSELRDVWFVSRLWRATATIHFTTAVLAKILLARLR
jgi:hypothetical protein